MTKHGNTKHASTLTYSVGGPGVAWRETGGEIVVLDIPESVYFGLNSTGAELWKRLAAGADRAELAEILESRQNVEAERAGADVDAFLAELTRHGLLHQL